jgi:ssDNA thymidine ADP-ribosyltransferase, DarT
MSSKDSSTYIYHITHIQNLSKILNVGCLWCDRERKEQNIETQGIAYDAIKERRSRRSVPTCQGGFVADYVPFYFAPRSPMLFAIHRGTVDNYQGGQESILHLVSKAEVIAEKNLPFTFTNGHAEMALTEFYENLGDLDKIDWDLMKSKHWNDIETDMNRKWRRQAEFLVHNRFPVDLIAGIGVLSERIKTEVEKILRAANIEIKVAVLPTWYY